MDKTPKQKDAPYNQVTPHIPVLLQAVVEYLAPQKGDRYLDLTAGAGGHAAAVLSASMNPSGAVLVDRDQTAVKLLEDKFSGTGVQILQADFLTASRQLVNEQRQFDVILADLGVSSMHLNQANRGFSIKADGPLDMRMDQSQSLTAATIVNTYTEGQLANLLATYGEEPKAKQIAHMVVKNRPLETTSELATLVARAWPGHYKVHPATRTFQALRIAVNGELDLLMQSLPVWIQLLAPGGRLAIISFHSLEDRLVKQYFQEVAGDRYDAELRLLTKHPATASADELVFNPRARSAKLRAAVKIKK